MAVVAGEAAVPPPQVSVVIPTLDTRDDLRRCLRSVHRQAQDVRMETVVVDNGSADGSTEMVRREFPWACAIRLEENVGYSRAVNRGLAVSTGDVIIVLNADALAHDGGFVLLWEALTRDPSLGAGCPRCIDPDGTLQSQGHHLVETRDFLNDMLGRGYPDVPPQDPARDAFVDTPSGACLCLTRRGLTALGGLDERLLIYLEEQDIGRRLLAAGLRSRYVAAATVTHVGGTATRQLSREEVFAWTHKTRARFYRKHLSAAAAAMLLAVGATEQALRLVNSCWKLASGQRRLREERARMRAKWRALTAYLGLRP